MVSFLEAKMELDFYGLAKSWSNKGGPDLSAELTFPNPLFTFSELRNWLFFISPSGSGVLPHAHLDVLNILISGRKRWILFDKLYSAQSESLHRKYLAYGKDFSWEDWYEQEYDELCETLPVFECEQEAGDILYIPAHYVHAVFNLGEVLGMIYAIAVDRNN